MSVRQTAESAPALVSIPLGLAFTWALFSLIPLITSGRAVGVVKKPPMIVELIELPPPPVVTPPPPVVKPPPPIAKKAPPPVDRPPPKPVIEREPPAKPNPPAVKQSGPPHPALPAADSSEEPATVGTIPPAGLFLPETEADPGPAAEPVKDPPPHPPVEIPVAVPFFRLTAAPAFLSRVTPVYPEDMKRIGQSGTVEVKALIDAAGKVREVTVVKSAGEAFDEAAVKALLASTFTPGEVNGKPVAVLYRTTVRFRLK